MIDYGVDVMLKNGNYGVPMMVNVMVKNGNYVGFQWVGSNVMVSQGLSMVKNG